MPGQRCLRFQELKTSGLFPLRRKRQVSPSWRHAMVALLRPSSMENQAFLSIR